MRVKLILPALTEATSPFFRPIKYSLFPPLGLATLAGYLLPDAEVRIVDEHVEKLAPGRRARPRGDTGLHHVSATRLRNCRPLSAPRRPGGARRAARHVAAGRGSGHADTIFLGPGEDTWPAFLADLRAGRAAARYESTGAPGRACRRCGVI